MTGGTGAVGAGCRGARLAPLTEPRSGAGTAVSPWPLQSELELGALPTAVPCFRLHARAVVIEWRLPGLVEPAELLACELTTNAVHAARRLAIRQIPVVRLRMVSDGACVVICVWDGNDQMPARRDAGPDEDSGRGLMLVEALAKDWGAYRQADGGKVVWAMLAAGP